MDLLIDIGLYLSYILVIVSVLTSIILPTLHLIKKPKELLQTIYMILSMLGLFGVCFAFSSYDETEKISWIASKVIGAGMFTTYFLFIVAFLGILYSEIINSLR